MTVLILNWHQACEAGLSTRGDKGYHLAKLRRAGFPVPDWEELPLHSPFRRELGRFLEDVGHRAVCEADVINPQWRDDPGDILDQVRCMLDTPLDGGPRQAARQVSAAAQAEIKRLTRWPRPLLGWLVRQVQRGFALREEGKSGMVASLSHGAIVAREYGLPAVVNIPGIVSHIKDGETLTVDGDAATVRRIP